MYSYRLLYHYTLAFAMSASHSVPIQPNSAIEYHKGDISYLDGSRAKHQNFSTLVPSPYDRSYGMPDSKRARTSSTSSTGQEHLLQYPPRDNSEAGQPERLPLVPPLGDRLSLRPQVDSVEVHPGYAGIDPTALRAIVQPIKHAAQAQGPTGLPGPSMAPGLASPY